MNRIHADVLLLRVGIAFEITARCTYMKAMAFSECPAPQSVAADEWAKGTTFALPFFLFQGDQDVITPPAAALRFFADVTAPTKRFAFIEDASHCATFRHPDRFLDLLLTHVRPALTSAKRPVGVSSGC